MLWKKVISVWLNLIRSNFRIYKFQSYFLLNFLRTIDSIQLCGQTQIIKVFKGLTPLNSLNS